MIQLYICDDEYIFCEKYRKMAEQILGRDPEIRTYTDPCIFWEELQQVGADIVLLDIDMPGLDGLEIAARMDQLPCKPILIFVTCQDALVYQTFQYHPFGFIRKSCVEQEMEPVLLEALEEWKKRNCRFTFRSDSQLITLPLEEIFYFEALGNYLNLHTEHTVYRIRETMANVERELGVYGFVRIHKGYLVNQQAVYRIGSNEVVVKGNNVLPIGRSCREQAREQLVRYMMS